MIRYTGAENSQGSPQILWTSYGGTDAWPRLREPLLGLHTRACCVLRLHGTWHELSKIGRTFSRWMSLLIWEILIFRASSSSSGTRGMLGTASSSSTIWKLRSVSGMYHLQSYCWVLLGWRGTRTLTDRTSLCF